MSPHQHGEVGIGVFEIGSMSWLVPRQNSAPLSLLVQMQKFPNDIIAFSSPFINANDSAWIGMWIAIRTLDHAAKLRIPLMSGLLEALLRELSSVSAEWEANKPTDSGLLGIKNTYKIYLSIRVVLNKMLKCAQSPCDALWVSFAKIIAL